MEKKITDSMSGLAAAATTFSGTIFRINSTGELGVESSGSATLSLAMRLAPRPGRIALTMTSPARIARVLERT